MPKTLKKRALSRKARKRRLQMTGAGILVALLAILLIIVTTGADDPDTDGPDQLAAPSPSGEEWTTEAFTGGPRLAVDRTEIAYGNVDYGEPVEAVYRVRNVGDEVATIDEVSIKTLEGC